MEERRRRAEASAAFQPPPRRPPLPRRAAVGRQTVVRKGVGRPQRPLRLGQEVQSATAPTAAG
jgi:hypothetical protein